MVWSNCKMKIEIYNWLWVSNIFACIHTCAHRIKYIVISNSAITKQMQKKKMKTKTKTKTVKNEKETVIEREKKSLRRCVIRMHSLFLTRFFVNIFYLNHSQTNFNLSTDPVTS